MLDDYQLLVRTIELGSITAAAEALGLSRPTLSRRLAALEERLGVALLHRTTRRLTPTPAGRRMFERMRPLLEDMARVEALIVEERDEVRGRLRVSVPPVIAIPIAEVVVQLQREHPQLSVELVADLGWANLREDEVDVALRAGRLHDPELIQRRLITAEVSAVASPAYLARRGTPSRLDELAAHTLLRGYVPEGTPQPSWPLRDGGRLSVDGNFATNDQLTLRALALAGEGIALLSEVTSGSDLRAGRLLRVLPNELGTRLRLHAVFARKARQPARIRVFVDALVRRFASPAAADPSSNGAESARAEP